MKDLNLLISVAAFVIHFTFGFFRGRFKRFSRPWSRCLYIPIMINIVVRRFVLDWGWQTAMVYLWPATLIAHILGGFWGSRRKKEEKMKTIMILSAVLLFLTAPAFAELSSADLEKIRAIIKEEVAAVETRLTDRIERSEEHLKEYVTQEIGKVNIKIDEMDKRLTGRIDEMDKRLTGRIDEIDKRLTGKIDGGDKQVTGEISGLKERFNQLFVLVTVLLTAVIAIVGVPLTIVLFQLKRQAAEQKALQQVQRSQDEKIEALQQELAERNRGSIITPQ